MGRARLSVERGDSLDRTVLWEQPDDSPVDLTGAVVTCNITVGDTVYDLSEGDGLTVDDESGSISISLLPEQTDVFDARFGKWKLYVLSEYTATTLAEGLFFVSFYE